DYIYVDDGAAAYLRTAEVLATDRALAGEAFNFSNQEPVTVRQIVERMLVVAGRHDLSPDVRNEATHEIREQTLDAGKARARLGWQARFTLDEGLRLTHHWYRDFLAEPRR
ncbi:MAG: rfbG, partial [bacterium]|nr:rfbG [bacterium]